MDSQDLLADSVLASRDLLARYLAGFDDSNHTRSARDLPNHAAWILGHCAMTMQRAAEKVDGRTLPETDFIPGAQRGDPRRFGTESVAFGSTPSGDAAAFPAFARCREIFDAAVDRLAGAVRSAPTRDLESPSRFSGGVELPLWYVVPRIVFHNGTHCGQLADLRRALGMARVLG